LDFVGVDDLGDVWVSEDGSVELVADLLVGWESVCSEDFVEAGEGGLSPDDESSEVTTWGELLEVKSGDVADIDSWDVSDSSEEVDVFVGVDEKRASSDLESLISDLSNSWSEGFVVGNSFNIFPGTDLLKKSDDVLGLLDSFDLVVNNAWDVGDLGDLVASSKDEWSNSRSSQSGSDGVSSLLEVDLSVPSSPGLQWGEHSSLSAHVTESSLA